MAVQVLEDLLRGYVNSLRDEGILNDQFLSLKNTRAPNCVVETIEKYFADVDKILSELSDLYFYIDNDNSRACFCKLASLVQEIEDKSASIGAAHMKLSSSTLMKACEENHIRNFTISLAWLKTEFTNTRSKLESVVQMEQRIIRLGSSGSQN